MFKTMHNMMQLKVKITPQTPLLVASGKTFDVTRPDIGFMRVRGKEGETIYVPGSSLKGVLRSGLEAMLAESGRFVDATDGMADGMPNSICMASEVMCHDRKENKQFKKNNKLPYGNHCPVCRMFGSGDMASRLEISDVFPYRLDAPAEEKRNKIKAAQEMISTRTGIKIDRKTGKTKGGALFEYEILGGGELFGEFTFTNYELYQPGLLFTLFDLSSEGFLRYGHSKSRGLGVLNFAVESLKIIQMGRLKGNQLKGVGMLHDNAKYKGYNFYLKGNDAIGTEYPTTEESNVLYTAFYFDCKENIADVTAGFKGKIDGFLEG